MVHIEAGFTNARSVVPTMLLQHENHIIQKLHVSSRLSLIWMGL